MKQATPAYYVIQTDSDDQPVFPGAAYLTRCDVPTCRALVLETDKGQHMLGHEQAAQGGG
jgi:hypothetical protein